MAHVGRGHVELGLPIVSLVTWQRPVALILDELSDSVWGLVALKPEP